MATTALPSPGPLRARALLDAAAETDDVLGSLHVFARALDQPGLTPDLRAKIHVLRAQFESAGLGRIDDAIGSFDAAANARPSAGLLGCALAGAAYYRFAPVSRSTCRASRTPSLCLRNRPILA